MSIDKTKITEELSCYLNENTLAKGVKLESHIPFTDLGIDSMTVVELVMFIEEKFGIGIPLDQLLPENLRSIDSLANCVLENAKASRG